MRGFVAAAMLVGLAGPVFAQDNQIERLAVDTMEVFRPSAFEWKDEPTLPKGAKSVLLVGDPTKPGVFILRLQFPANYVIGPHTHPYTEVITVLSGKLGNGMGEKFDAGSGDLLGAGESFVLPADHAHYVWTTDEETVVELIATGPWDITYLDPAEDPRK